MSDDSEIMRLSDFMGKNYPDAPPKGYVIEKRKTGEVETPEAEQDAEVARLAERLKER